MITPKHAITAASCFENGKWNPFDVTFSDGTAHSVDKVYLTGCYHKTADTANYGYDIAIIRFTKATTVKPYPIFMFLNEEQYSLVTIMGFGTSKPAFSTDVGEKGVLAKGTNIIDVMEKGQLTYEWNDINKPEEGATMQECAGD